MKFSLLGLRAGRVGYGMTALYALSGCAPLDESDDYPDATEEVAEATQALAFGTIPIRVPTPDPADLPPNPPSPFGVMDWSDTAVTLRWQDRSEHEERYELWRSEIDVSGGRYESPWDFPETRVVGRFGPLSGWNTYVDTTARTDESPTCYHMVGHNDNGSRASLSDCAYDDECIYTGPRNRPNPRSRTLDARIRVLTQNVYGTTAGDCDERLEALGEEIARTYPPYDIVAVQELYGTNDLDWINCDAGEFNDAIRSTGRYPYRELYEPSSRFWKADGGIGIFSRSPIWDTDSEPWKAEEWGVKDAEQGILFTRVRVPATSFSIDTYVVHLDADVDGGSRDIRKKELRELAAMIEDNSSTSGNPVLVMGDFNIGGPPHCRGNTGYKDIMSVLGDPIDLWAETYPEPNGGTHKSQRIDYMLHVTDPKLTNSPFQLVVEKMNRHLVFTKGQVTSDHAGLDATLGIWMPCPHAPGHPDYCRDCGPCDMGEADCDYDSQCADALICSHDVGTAYGLPYNYDVCECPWSIGDANYCRDCGPCELGEGRCESDSGCRTGLVCLQQTCQPRPPTSADPQRCYSACVADCLRTVSAKEACPDICEASCTSRP